METSEKPRLARHIIFKTVLAPSLPKIKMFARNMAIGNMADEGTDNIWKRKFLTLESRVKLVELVSLQSLFVFFSCSVLC
jgi:hypothetical protein